MCDDPKSFDREENLSLSILNLNPLESTILETGKIAQ